MKITVLILIMATVPFLACKEIGKSEQVEKAVNIDSLKLAERKLKAFSNIADFEEGKSKSFYEFIPESDSTFSVKWGTHHFTRVSKTVFPRGYFDLGFNEFFEEDWIGIRGHSGSDVWFIIALPLDSILTEREFWNYLTVDWKNGMIVTETERNKLIIENMKTQNQKQSIDVESTCDSAFPHYCIDSIWFKKNELNIAWITPNKIHEPNDRKIRKYKIDLNQKIE